MIDSTRPTYFSLPYLLISFVMKDRLFIHKFVCHPLCEILSATTRESVKFYSINDPYASFGHVS